MILPQKTPLLISIQLLIFLLSFCHSGAAVFPAFNSEAARIEIADSQGLLSWNPAGISPAPNALTVMFWAKIAIPDDSSFPVTEDMTLLGNRRSGDWSQPHAYRFYFNATTGNLEFSARGSNGALPRLTLIEKPYLGRWYHLAAVRSGAGWAFYVDGRAVPAPTLPDIGNSNSTDGVSFGGLETKQRLFGEIQEFALFQRQLTASAIQLNRLRDIPASFDGLRGYYKLSYAPLAADTLKNSAAAPPSPLNPVADATTLGTGVIDFPEADKQGEQSLFDSLKNQGRNAQNPLSGSFSWQRTLFSRPTAGVPFEFRIGYNSGISFNSQALENGADMFSSEAVLGPGWRHSFQTRLIPGQQFLATGSSYLGLLIWDGSLETWQRSSGRNYKTLHSEYRGELQENPDGDAILWITPERLIYEFYHPGNEPDPNLVGKLKSIRDFNGNTVTLSYEPSQGLLDKVTDTAGTVWQFTYNPGGRLETITGLGWTGTFKYTQDALPRLESFSRRGPAAYESVPPLNTSWTFAYEGPNGLLSKATTPRGTVDVSVGYDRYGRKTVESDGEGRSTGHAYLTPGPRQITRTDGDGKKWIETYDRKGHLLIKTDPLGNSFRNEYYALGDPMPALGTGATAPVAGVLKRQTEPLGWVTRFDAYDERGNLLQRTDPLGYVWKWVFAKPSDPAGANGRLVEALPAGSTATAVTALLNRPLKDIRPRVTGETADWENRYLYNSRGSLLRHEDNISPLAIYAYDARGLVISGKDGNLNETRTTYFPGTGFPETVTTAFGKPDQATTTFTVTEMGWVKSVSNTLDELTSMEFDINGNTIRTTDAIGRTLLATYDEVGNLRIAKDGKGVPTEHRYDNSNLRTWTSDRLGNISTSEYNRRSQLSSASTPPVPVSQPAGDPVWQSLKALRTYDEAGRLRKETDPAGRMAEHRYDGNGNETETVDREGRIWRKQYDRLNRPAVELDPLGNTRTSLYDEAGRIKTVTAPGGAVTRHVYDGRGRLREWTDPTGATWIYTYDFVGNITDIEDALHGHYSMTYDARNLRLTEKNQDGLLWIYTYDPLGRLKTQQEPTGISRTVSYDPVGRVETVSFSTGRSNQFDYDDNNNLDQVRRTDSSGTTRTTIAYDGMDRPKTSTDNFQQIVGYGYDAIGRVTSLIYPGSRMLNQEFDTQGRLVRQRTGSNWGSHELTYQWDAEGRLVRQTYPNGLVRNAAWDEAGRQKSLGFLDSKGNADPADDAVLIALSYAYDKNGNLTDSREKGLLVPAPPTPHDITSKYSAAGRLETRNDAAAASGQKNWTYDFKKPDGSPSFNLSRAACPSVGTLDLAYDEDNRTTSIAYIPSAAPLPGQTLGPKSTITNRYDALGRRISKRQSTTAAGGSTTTVESRYVLSLIGGMERILADTTATGQITALYIHGPDLAVKVDASTPSKFLCYHSDVSGNVVRITDQTKAAVSEYAYSDYGGLLGFRLSTGTTDSNLYRFVGSQGVMAEPLIPGLYFMRARYYLADASVFLSVDPVKNIGPGWKPTAYNYALNNPIADADPTGLMSQEQMAKIERLIRIQTYENDSAFLNLQSTIYNSQADVMQATVDAWKSVATLANPVSALNNISVALAIGRQFIGFGEVTNIIKSSSLRDSYDSVVGVFDFGTSLSDASKALKNTGHMLRSAEALANKPLSQINKYIGSSPSNLATMMRGITTKTMDIAEYYAANSNKWSMVSPGSPTVSSNQDLRKGASGFFSPNSGVPAKPGTITIQAGDTLSKLAKNNNTDVATLIRLNPQISDPNRIYAGAKLNVPGK